MSRFSPYLAVPVVLVLAGCGDRPTEPSSEPLDPDVQAARSGATGPPVEVSCGQVITESVKLANDLTNCPDGLDVGADDIVIDGRGHTIAGPGGTEGIWIYGRTGVTVKNLRITGFRHGITVGKSSGIRIEQNEIVDNHQGITLHDGVRGSEIVRNDFTSNRRPIMMFAGSDENSIVRNGMVDSRFDGISLEFSSRNELVGNSIERGGEDGVSMFFSSDNIVERNRVEALERDAFRIVGDSRGNVLRNNRADEVGLTGFTLSESASSRPTDNTLTGNRVSGADSHGFQVSGEDNDLVRNAAVGNAGYGFLDTSTGSGSAGTANQYERNRCRDNEAGPSSPAELCRSPGG